MKHGSLTLLGALAAFPASALALACALLALILIPHTSSSASPNPAPQTPPAPTAPSPPTTGPLTPEFIAAARDKSARETSAALCASNNFNEWVKTQGHPLPDPNVRMAKMIDISNQCRRPLNLEDMIPPPLIIPPKPILSGPAGDAAAAKLAELVKSGSIERLQKYLSSPGVDINDRPGTNEALLDYAAEQNQAKIARYLIDHGALVDAIQTQGPNRGLSALHRAATVDAADVAELLLAHGASAGRLGPSGITPLILAASNGSRRTAELLLNHGADILTLMPSGNRTALSEAIAHGHKDVVQLLLLHVPANTVKDIISVAGRGDLNTLRLILMHDELVHDVDAPSKDQALRFTLLGGPGGLEERKQMIELLLAHGADIDHYPVGTVEIPLMSATTPDMVEFLLAHGANQKAQFPGAQLAMAYVCNKNVKDPLGALQVLVSHGIDIGGRPLPRSYSAMECATRSGNSLVLQYLKDHGARDEGTVQAAARAPSVGPAPSPMTQAGSSPGNTGIESPATVAKERRASELLAAINKDAIHSSANSNPTDRARQMAPYFLKKLDPSNTNWNDRNPGWPTMAWIVEKSLLEEISDKPTNETLNIETATVGAYAAKMTDDDLRQMATYVASTEGKRYAAFQTQIELVFNEGIRALQSNRSKSQEPAADVIQKRRLQLLALSSSAMITVAQYDIAQSQHADISGFSALPIMMGAAAMNEASQLDALATHFDADIPRFVSFSQTATAKHHFAALAAAQTVGAPLLLAQVEEFARRVEARHMTQWQQVYKERVQKP
jgi:ankyrin repeat protein